MAVFARWARRRVDTPDWTPRQPATPTDRVPPLDAGASSCPDPAAQVELVEDAMAKLDAVRMLVVQLPEIPLGDRQSLIAQLTSTVDSLRSLTFLDAIY